MRIPLESSESYVLLAELDFLKTCLSVQTVRRTEKRNWPMFSYDAAFVYGLRQAELSYEGLIALPGSDQGPYRGVVGARCLQSRWDHQLLLYEKRFITPRGHFIG